MITGVFAHNPNEITYNFNFKKSQKELNIQFTPKSAIDLVVFLHPEKKNDSLINIENHLNEFENYFNETIYFKMGKSVATFKLLDYDIRNHDASLRFKIENLIQVSSEFSVTITSFNSIYDRLNNSVVVKMDDDNYNYNLNNENTICSSVINKSLSGFSHFHLEHYLLIFLLLALVVLVLKKLN